jgi:hypothetical protein
VALLSTPNAAKPVRVVFLNFRGDFLDVVHHQHADRHFSILKPQAELVLKRA